MDYHREISLRDMLHRAAKWYPQREAAVDDTVRYTYGELLGRARQMAQLLHERGVRKGDRVALLLYPSANHVVTLFGIIEIGAIPCALHLRESAALLEAVLERLSPRALVYDVALGDLVADLRTRTSLITAYVGATSERSGDADQQCQDPVIPRDLDGLEMDFEPMALYAHDPALIALSSGTTGVPKGILHSHRNLVESARGGVNIWGITPHSAIVNLSTTAFIGWYNCALPFFNVCAKVAFMSQWQPQKFLQKMQDERCDVAFLVPTMWRMLLREPLGEYDLSTVRMAGFAGEAMDTSTMAAVRERIAPKVMNIYGTTETGSCAAGTIMYNEDFADTSKIESVGKPFMNADVRVIRPGGTVDDVLGPNEEGEVVIRGLSVAQEVWDQPEVARRIFEGPWWHSGDMGRLDEDQYLYLHGRIDDMIISGGINILPARVEEAVLSHPAVSECAVIGLPDPEWGQCVAAFVIISAEVREVELDIHVRDSDLADYQRPRVYRFVDELPKGPTGKVSRRLLRDSVQKDP